MLQEARRVKPPEVPAAVQLTSLASTAADGNREALLHQLAKGTSHEDLRDWLEMVDAIGELRVLDGVDAEENIGRISEMLHHTDGAPAVLFDRIPGYEPGYRILVNAQGERRRLNVSLGLPVDTGTWELMYAWEKLMD